jgi:hypothetical protein
MIIGFRAVLPAGAVAASVRLGGVVAMSRVVAAG